MNNQEVIAEYKIEVYLPNYLNQKENNKMNVGLELFVTTLRQ